MAAAPGGVDGADATRGGGGSGSGGDGSWTPFFSFLEQSLWREFTPFFLKMMATVCGGVSSLLIEPKMGREGKGPT